MLAVLAAALLEVGPGISAPMHVQNHAARSNAMYSVTEHGASGSGRSTLGSVVRGENTLRLDVRLDFKNGEGIKIEHAGTGCTLSGKVCPVGPQPTVAVQGSAGSTTYRYRLAVIDERGGVGPAGPTATVTNGPPAINTQRYNWVRWEPIPAAPGYALYRNDRLLLVLSGLTPEGYYEPPRGPAFTSSFKDMGLVAEKTSYPDIPLTPPEAARADALVTTITAGGGTRRLQFKDKASTSIQQTVIIHDDSEALQSAFDAVGSGGTVYFPAGSYLFTQPGFLIERTQLKILGDGKRAAILKDNLIGNSFARWIPPTPCGFLSPVNSADIEISYLTILGLAPFGSSMTRRKKAICATGAFERLYVHDVIARNISGEAIYAEDLRPGEVSFSSNTVEDCAKNALNTNSATFSNVIVDHNVVRKVNGAAILVVAQRALVARNKITGGAPIGADVVNVAVTNSFTIAGNEISGVDTSLAATSLIHVGFRGSGLNGSGMVVGNVIRDNQTLTQTQGGAILLDDVSEPVLIGNNLIEQNHGCCGSGGAAISIANKADKVLITDNTIRGAEGDQEIGIRLEKSVPAGNHIIVRHNDSRAGRPTVFTVNPNGGSESEFSELLRTAKGWGGVQVSP